MKHLKKSFILLTILFTSLLVFTSKVFAESEYITFNYYENLEGESLVNLHASNMPSQQTFKKGVTFSNIIKPASVNYTFNYWVYYDEGVEYILRVGDKFYTDTDFYAVWTPTLRGIYYYLNGGANHKNNQNHFYGYQTVSLEDPVKAGYRFLGWYNNPSFNLDPITSLGDGDKSTSLYAKWEKLPTLEDLRDDLNNEFNENAIIDEVNDINVLFNSLIETTSITSDLTDVIEVLIDNITSGNITINSTLYSLEEINITDIVNEVLAGVDLQAFLDAGNSINISYIAEVLYKGENFSFNGDFSLNVDVVTEVEVETIEELLFVLARPKVEDIYLVEDITLTSNIAIDREINLYSLNNILNFNGYDILFTETDDDAYYEIKGIFQNGRIILNNSNGHFDLVGLEGTDVDLIVIASASNTVNVKGFWGSLNVNDSVGKTVVEAVVDSLVVQGTSKVEVLNSSINLLNITGQAVVIVYDEVIIVEIENENNGLYYDEVETYNVSFNVDGGSATATQTVNSGNKVVKPTNPTKIGYTFVNWYFDGVLFDFNTQIKDNLTLDAVYELNNFNITIGGYSNPVTYPNNVNLTASNDALVGDMSYEWFKGNVLVSESNSLTLTEVDDSGTYTVYVTLTDDSNTLTLNKQITVSILPEEVLVTATGELSKTYGDNEPNYSYNLSKNIDISGSFSRVTGEDAGSYLFVVDDLIPDSNNYKLVINENVKFTINKANATLSSVFADANGYKAVEIDYTDNAIKTFTSSDLEEGLLNVFVGSIDETNKVDFNFNTIDLSNGASTFIEQVTITGNNINSIVVNVSFKFKSVIIEGIDTLYTVEDAISNTAFGDRIIVLYNTSFAESDVATILYNHKKYHQILNGVYLMLPNGLFDDKGKHEIDINKSIGGAPEIDRNNCLVRLNVPSNITIDVVGRLIVNAIRGAAKTAYQGFVTGSNYTILNLQENSKIIIKGRLYVSGFVTGEGLIDAQTGSTIYDVMFVESFRGGTDTYNIFEHAFPFYQFSVANIEVDVKINSGTTYRAGVFLYMDGSPVSAELIIVEPVAEKSKALIQLDGGYVMKKYDATTGETLIELNNGGRASLNETNIKAGAFYISSVGIDMSFNGRWKFAVKDNSELTINSYMLLFPGSSITVDENASLIVNEGARLTVFNPYEFIEDDKLFNKYPNLGVLSYFRTEINYSYNAYTPAELNVNGTLIVNSGAEIAGVISEGPNANILIDEDAITEYTIKYVLGSSYAYVLERIVKLWTNEDYYISVTANPVIGFKPKQGQEETPFNSTIKTYVKDKFGNVVNGAATYVIESYTIIRDSKGNMIGIDPTGEIVSSGSFNIVNGIGTFNFTTDVYNAYEVKVTYEGETSYVMLYVGEASSPFLYSEDEKGEMYFEHEPFSFSMLKAVEGTTYGTLRLIQDQNGIYYIQIIEEGNSTTALNNVELYAIDYEANQGVIDAMFDVLGNPHTIKERISPIAFVDQFGNSHLNKVLSKDNVYAAVNNTDDLISYFVATFNKPSNTNHVKLMISAREVGNTLDVLYQVLQTINAQDNLWWLDEALMNDAYSNEAVQKVFDSVLKLYIEVWDGEKWIRKASIDPGTYLTEEFLVELDLTNINTSDLKIRLVFPSEINYNIDSIYVDYSENVNMIVHKLDLVSATLNNEIDIFDLVNGIDNKYVYLDYKDSARLGFSSVTLAEGYERIIGVGATGYIYIGGAIIEDELLEEVKGKIFEDIVEVILNSNRPELIDYIEEVAELYYLLLHLGNLEYEEIIYIIFGLIN